MKRGQSHYGKSTSNKRHNGIRKSEGSLTSFIRRFYKTYFGAGRENRTPVSSLARTCSTTKPYPPFARHSPLGDGELRQGKARLFSRDIPTVRRHYGNREKLN